MGRRLPIFYNALLLTVVNLLLRGISTSFSVYLSGKIGASGIGLLQLVMSVGSLAMIAGIGGIRTATMYLTAEELGKDRKRNVSWVLSGCFGYSIVCSCGIGILLWVFAPALAEHWIGDIRVVSALRLLGGFLPVVCLSGVMTGYFTAANRIGMLSAVEVGEQLCSMGVTLVLLQLWAGTNPARVCESVVMGSCAGSLLTLTMLVWLHLKERTPSGAPIPVKKRLLQAAVPLGLADVVKSGITTTENLMVPKRLALNPQIADPLAMFGLLSGMVFPVIMFPACILFGLAELLIPELARCAAAGSEARVRYLVKRSLKTAFLYGLVFGALLHFLAEPLCIRLYGSNEAGTSMALYALLVPMLYCDAITDAMTKGLGQQKVCVRYNIFTSVMDVATLYFLLPEFGMKGYFVSFLISHLVNFILSLRRLIKISGVRLPVYVPVLGGSAALGGILGANFLQSAAGKCVVFALIFSCLLFLFRVVSREDIAWILGLIRPDKRKKCRSA